MDFSGFSVGWGVGCLVGLPLGMFWVLLINKVPEKFIAYRESRKHWAIGKASDQRLRMFHYALTSGTSDMLAFYTRYSDISFLEQHWKILAKGGDPLKLYPRYLRPKLFEAMYPDNGYYFMQWAKSNHPNILREYRVARKAREMMGI